MAYPGEIGIADGRHTANPALVFAQPSTAPIAVVERGICEDVVGLEVRVQIPVKTVSVFFPQVRLNTSDGEVHHRQPPGGVVGLLTVDRDIADLPTMGLDEFLATHEYAPAPAAGVKNPALVRREHFNQESHNTAGCVKLPALLALGTGKLA
jgi:hypothetical protein